MRYGNVSGVYLGSPSWRAMEKQASREEDVRALLAGEKTQEQLRQENGAFRFPKVRIRLDRVKT